MNRYVAFSLRSLAAFFGGIVTNTTGHALVLKDSMDWFMVILSGFVAMTAYWGGVVSVNPFAQDSRTLMTDPLKDRIE